MSEDRIPGFDTLAIHAGAKPDPATSDQMMTALNQIQ